MVALAIGAAPVRTCPLISMGAAAAPDRPPSVLTAKRIAVIRDLSNLSINASTDVIVELG
jgi:hypothetical protein